MMNRLYLLGIRSIYVYTKRELHHGKNYICRETNVREVNITICYLIAYGAAKPAVSWIFSGFNEKIQGNLSMLAGMCLFVVLNYLGQRLFVFRKKSE